MSRVGGRCVAPIAARWQRRPEGWPSGWCRRCMRPPTVTLPARCRSGRIMVELLAPPRTPMDPTAGEVPVLEFRGLVRRIADAVGKTVAAQIVVDPASG